MNKKTIFELLFEKQICFAVAIFITRMKNISIEENRSDYFVIVSDIDAKKLGVNFHRTSGYKNVYERDLSDSEILEFKKIQDKFIKVLHNNYGRVYELKDNSFKLMLEKT
jgi:hypothetical protein